ncbi:MAG: hypothetical protein HQ565_03020 [Bacteroidetes bacterium]|nr:hypothetical protein [Bacteroidota bacterium]
MKKQKRLFGGGLMLILLLIFNASSAFADIVIKNGATLTVSSGTEVVVSADIDIESGATLENNGTFTVKGDLNNDGTADLGSGDFIFNGSAVQDIGGTVTNEFEDLEIDNSSGVTLSYGALLDGTLTLTDGLFTIGTNNFIFGTAALAVAGTPSASNMIVADNTGEVRKMYADGTSDPAAFLFPLGDNTGTAEYSPVSIDLSNSTFASAYFGVTVTNAKEPNNWSSINYLSRYWTFTQSGISAGYTYGLTATYADGDITGTEADMSGALYEGADWLIVDAMNAGANTFSGSGLNVMGNITGVEFRLLLECTVNCEGAYQLASDEMTTVLNPNIPHTAAAAYAHIGYTGTESFTVIPSADIVDWILVEVRDATTPAGASTPGDTVAGFLMKNGLIVRSSGSGKLPFPTLIADDAYFVIIHRNHLPVMTATTPSEYFKNYTHDFTDAVTKAYTDGSSNPMVQVDTSPVAYGLYAGETNLSGIISNADKQIIDDNIDATGYHLADCNFSGIVSNADKQFLDDNMNKADQIPN